MDTKTKILNHIRKRKAVTGADLCNLLGISRQAVNKHLQELVQNGQVVKDGVTRGVIYRVPGRKARIPASKRLRKAYRLKGLQEDHVLRETDRKLRLRSELKENVWNILHYAFTEMLNNAIDHSRSESGQIEFQVDEKTIRFIVRDFGIGIFHSIASKFNLPDEHAAVGELIKGKTTTMKERHSGEGIFFTSKSAHRMTFRSHRTELIFDNSVRDVFVHEKRHLKGTQVVFELGRRSKKKLSDIFSEFAPEEFDYRFERTRVMVRLFEKEYISRSEARRLLHGLDRFKEVRLDFKGVKSMGQAFADEVFRVFLNAHPGIKMVVENLGKTLKVMVLHAVDNETKARLTIS